MVLKNPEIFYIFEQARCEETWGSEKKSLWDLAGVRTGIQIFWYLH